MASGRNSGPRSSTVPNHILVPLTLPLCRSSVFDFPLKGILQEAVKNCEYWRLRDSNGKAPGVAGYWPGMRGLETHWEISA